MPNFSISKFSGLIPPSSFQSSEFKSEPNITEISVGVAWDDPTSVRPHAKCQRETFHMDLEEFVGVMGIANSALNSPNLSLLSILYPNTLLDSIVLHMGILCLDGLTGTPKIVPYTHRVLTGCGYAYRYSCTRTGYGKNHSGTSVSVGYDMGTARVRHGYVFVEQRRGDFDPALSSTSTSTLIFDFDPEITLVFDFDPRLRLRPRDHPRLRLRPTASVEQRRGDFNPALSSTSTSTLIFDFDPEITLVFDFDPEITLVFDFDPRHRYLHNGDVEESPAKANGDGSCGHHRRAGEEPDSHGECGN
ncbi:hypothetical protein TEA_021242 [Camellia sinensis var. sinensis]|uniref:Uncharacterized protein n=1 Tax=Camellia sinensis var. sinensis TaxID=542762 RepID=A0A4V3WNZ1_CAMSN|nr:hypothetical protein TEA_021242 [Camellia sinensis var. sinensis]